MTVISKSGRRRVMIIEDHPYIAEATRSLIREISDVDVSITVATSADQVIGVLEHAGDLDWHLVLLDLNLSGVPNLSVARHLYLRGLASVTCILTGERQPEYIAFAHDAGFLGYILKGSSMKPFRSALTDVLKHHRSLPPRPLVQRSGSLARGLTSRQSQALQLVGRGLSSKQIAQEAKLSPRTVDNIVESACAALGVSRRAEAVAKAQFLGLIRFTEPAVQ